MGCIGQPYLDTLAWRLLSAGNLCSCVVWGACSFLRVTFGIAKAVDRARGSKSDAKPAQDAPAPDGGAALILLHGSTGSRLSLMFCRAVQSPACLPACSSAGLKPVDWTNHCGATGFLSGSWQAVDAALTLHGVR